MFMKNQGYENIIVKKKPFALPNQPLDVGGKRNVENMAKKFSKNKIQQ